MLLFESFNEIEAICQKYKIKNYTINPDGSIDVDGDVILSRRDKEKLPLKFREVTGSFDCSFNKLITLEGAPKSIGGDFDCYNNELTTLEGAPQTIDGYFLCYANQLTTLKGGPKSVSYSFDCTYNSLTTLEGAPQSVGGNFWSYGNPLDSIRELFPDHTTFYKLSMEWEFFAGGNKIWKHKLLEAMLDIGKKRVPKSIPGYEYI